MKLWILYESVFILRNLSSTVYTDTLQKMIRISFGEFSLLLVVHCRLDSSSNGKDDNFIINFARGAVWISGMSDMIADANYRECCA